MDSIYLFFFLIIFKNKDKFIEISKELSIYKCEKMDTAFENIPKIMWIE